MKRLLKSSLMKIVLPLMIPLFLILIGVFAFRALTNDEIKQVQLDFDRVLSNQKATLDRLKTEIENANAQLNELDPIAQYKDEVYAAMKEMETASEYPGSDAVAFKSKISNIRDNCLLKQPTPSRSSLEDLAYTISEYLNFAKNQYESHGTQLILDQKRAEDGNLYVATLESLLADANKKLDQAQTEIVDLKKDLKAIAQSQADDEETNSKKILASECDHTKCIKDKDAELYDLRKELEAAQLTVLNDVIKEIEAIKDITNPIWEAKEFKKIEALLNLVITERDRLVVELNKLLTKTQQFDLPNKQSKTK